MTPNLRSFGGISATSRCGTCARHTGDPASGSSLDSAGTSVVRSRGDPRTTRRLVRTRLYLTPAARAAELSNVRSFYRWALLEELIDRDPTLRLVRPRLPRRLPRPMADADIAKALAVAPYPIRAFLNLAAFAGLRACEIAPLRRSDVLDGASAPVLIVQNGKGGKQRIIPLAPELARTLTAAEMPTHGYLFRAANSTGHGSVNRRAVTCVPSVSTRRCIRVATGSAPRCTARPMTCG
jgi:integrase